MKKKLLAVITALALCLTLTPMMAFASPADAGGDDYAPSPDAPGGKEYQYDSMKDYYDDYYEHYDDILFLKNFFDVYDNNFLR